MKRMLLAVLLCVASVSVFSQKLLFKGHEITGNAWDMKNALEKEGYVYHSEKDERILLIGSYLGYKDSYIFLYRTLATSTLFSIQVALGCPTSTNINDQYKHIKYLLTEKYGQAAPATDFQNRNESFWMCIYWKVSGGEIVLCKDERGGAVNICFLPFGWRTVRDAELMQDM